MFKFKVFSGLNHEEGCIVSGLGFRRLQSLKGGYIGEYCGCINGRC